MYPDHYIIDRWYSDDDALSLYHLWTYAAISGYLVHYCRNIISYPTMMYYLSRNNVSIDDLQDVPYS